MLCPPQESVNLNSRLSNCQPKCVAACGWKRNHFDSIKVIKLSSAVVCFSESILGCPAVVTQTQEDHATHSNLREEVDFKTLLIYTLRDKCFGQKRKNPTTNNTIRGRQAKYTQINQRQILKESPLCAHTFQWLVAPVAGWAEGEGTRSLQVLVFKGNICLAIYPDQCFPTSEKPSSYTEKGTFLCLHN